MINSISWAIITIMTFVLPSSLLLIHSALTPCSCPGVDLDEPLLGKAAQPCVTLQCWKGCF